MRQHTERSRSPRFAISIRYSRRWLGVVLLILLSPAWTGCGSEPPTVPTPIPIPTTLGFISISGNFALTRIGETSQLTVTGIFTDSTRKDVTSDVKWKSPDARVVTISLSGMVTVVGFGSAVIACELGSVSAMQVVTVTPGGAFSITGVLSEPTANEFLGQFGGLPGVQVFDTLSGFSTTTDDSGRFTLLGLVSLAAHLRLQKDGYEPAEVELTRTGVELALQPIVRVIAGETVRPIALAPLDVAYVVGSTRCFPCRLIRLVASQPGTVRVRVSWAQASDLALLVGGLVVAGGTTELTADVPVDAPRELVMHFGSTSARPMSLTNFTVETSLH